MSIKHQKELEESEKSIDLYACVCSLNPSIHVHSTISCGTVIQISCKCGRGVHGRTIEQAKELWDIVQLHLYDDKAKVLLKNNSTIRVQEDLEDKAEITTLRIFYNNVTEALTAYGSEQIESEDAIDHIVNAVAKTYGVY